MNRTSLAMVAVLAAGLLVVGCKKEMIPNTEIEDNGDNREIISFCERYRHAVEDMNVGLLMSLASPRYFDNSGTVTGDDDYDRDGLEEILIDRFKLVKAMRYEIKYRNLFEADGLIYVEYTYNMSFQYELNDSTKWSNKTADNRLEIERVDSGFLIVSGM